jgi:hypothetical protein
MIFFIVWGVYVFTAYNLCKITIRQFKDFGNNKAKNIYYKSNYIAYKLGAGCGGEGIRKDDVLISDF